MLILENLLFLSIGIPGEKSGGNFVWGSPLFFLNFYFKPGIDKHIILFL